MPSSPYKSSITATFQPLLLIYNLEDKELQIIALIRRPKDRMVRCLRAEFYLAEPLMGCLGCFLYCLCQKLLRHEVGAGTGGEISAVFHKL